MRRFIEGKNGCPAPAARQASHLKFRKPKRWILSQNLLFFPLGVALGYRQSDLYPHIANRVKESFNNELYCNYHI